MRYWSSKPTVNEQKGRARRSARRSIASGGSLKDYPFLRKFYQHQAEISSGIQKFFFFLVVATLIYAFVLGDGGAVRILILRHKRAELERDIARLKKSVEILDQEIERLRNDPFYIEKVGRERYGYLYPGDRVYKLVPGKEGKEKD